MKYHAIREYGFRLPSQIKLLGVYVLILADNMIVKLPLGDLAFNVNNLHCMCSATLVKVL